MNARTSAGTPIKVSSNTSAPRTRIVRRFALIFVAVGFCTAILDCDGTGVPAADSDSDTPPPTVVNVAVAPWLFVEAGGSASTLVDLQTNNTQGRTLPGGVDYTLSQSLVYDSATLDANFDAEFSFAEAPAGSGSASAQIMTVDVDSDSRPGVYRYSIFTRGLRSPFNFNDPGQVAVVVVPTSRQIATGAVSKIAAGNGFALALLESGSVWAWGRNDLGQLGDGTRIDRSAPVRVLDLPIGVSDIAAGVAHGVAISGGRVYTWGANSPDGSDVELDRIGILGLRAEPGTGFTVAALLPSSPGVSTTPAPLVVCRDDAPACSTVPDLVRGITVDEVELLGGAVEVSAGAAHTLVRLTSGEVLAWGDNAFGQRAGAYGREGRQTVVTVPLPRPAATIAAGANFSLAVLDSGRVWGWGQNDLGQLGNNRVGNIEEPIDLPALGNVAEVSSGGDHTLFRIAGLAGFGALGANVWGQIGDGSTDPRDSLAPVDVGAPITQVAAGRAHSLVLTDDDRVFAFGDNSFSQLAGASADISQLVPEAVPELADIAGIEAGDATSYAVPSGCGNVLAWGRNLFGELGRASLAEASGTPYPVYGLGELGIEIGCPVGLQVFQNEGGRIQSAPSGFAAPGCGDPVCVTTVPIGETVTVSAVADEGFEFAGWSGDCSGPSPNFTFAVIDSRNCFATYTVATAPPPDNPPVAAFSFAPVEPRVNQTVSFDASASADDVAIASYAWDFDNDGTTDANGVTASTAYTAAGEVTAALTVTDSAGQTASTSAVINVALDGGGTGRSATLTLTFAGPGSGTVTVAPINLVLPNSSCDGASCFVTLDVGEYTLQAAAASGATFAGWQAAQCDAISGSECTIELQEDREVVAAFN